MHKEERNRGVSFYEITNLLNADTIHRDDRGHSSADEASFCLKAYLIISPRPLGGRGVGGEGGSNRCRFSRPTPTFACPHPNPLPEGEGDFGIGSKLRTELVTVGRAAQFGLLRQCGGGQLGICANFIHALFQKRGITRTSRGKYSNRPRSIKRVKMHLAGACIAP